MRYSKWAVAAVYMFMWMLAGVAWAASNSVSGLINIDYESRRAREQGASTKGVYDKYRVDNLTIGDTIVLSGLLEHLPNEFNSMGMMTQAGELRVDLVISVRNPANLAQSVVVGKLMGVTPIDSKGVYQFGDGTMRAGMNAMKRAPAYESAFAGSVQGVALNTNNWWKKQQDKALEMTKMVQGTARKIAVTKYDQMIARGFVLPSFPAQEYPAAVVQGGTVYDYERDAWLFRDLAITPAGGQPDRIGGSILWVESDTGGTYQFDVRVNEPVLSVEAAAFMPASAEADFFAEDVSIPGFTGTMVFTDTTEGESVTASRVVINLTGNQVTKAQARNIATMFLLAYVVPMCGE